MYCKNCGAKIEDGAVFCPACGMKQTDTLSQQKKSRTTEFILGLLGGIFGSFVAIFLLFYGSVGEAFGAENATDITTIGSVGLLFSMFSIVGAVLVKSKNKLAGLIMLISAGIFLVLNPMYALSFILLLLAGITALWK